MPISQITAASIADGTVIASDIADGAVTGPKIGANAINANNVVSGTFAQPGSATTFTAKQTFDGSSSVAAIKLTDTLETVNVTSTAASSNINYDITTQSILYANVNATGNWTVNFRGSSGTALNTLMASNESMTCVLMALQGDTAYYANTHQIDGTGITPKWQGNTAPTSGNSNSIDIYSYTIIKRGNATFDLFASQTQFAR